MKYSMEYIRRRFCFDFKTLLKGVCIQTSVVKKNITIATRNEVDIKENFKRGHGEFIRKV